MCPGDLAGGGTGQGLLARKDHSYINVPWRRREAARSSKQRMAQAERDCLILSGNTTSHTRSCPSRRPGREQRVLCEAGRRRGSDRRGSPPAKALAGIGRALSSSRGAHILLASQSAPAQESELSPGLLLLDPPVQRACSRYLAPPRLLSLTATHSSPPAEWDSSGSSSTCTNHSAFCFVWTSQGQQVFLETLLLLLPHPHPTCAGQGTEQPPA